MSILDCFPSKFAPREAQKETLLSIEKDFDNYDVFVINIPVAGGKSWIAKTLADFNKRAAIITPTNLLVEQYVRDFPKLTKIYGKGNYGCASKEYDSCLDATADRKRCKAKRLTCPNCPWRKDDMRMRNPYLTQYVTNYHMYANRLKHLDMLIIDEAHNMIDFLQDWHSTKINYDKFKYPRKSSKGIDRKELREWVNNLKGIDDISTNAARGFKGVKELRDELNSSVPKYLIKEDFNIKNNKVEYFLKLCPIDIRGFYPFLWPFPNVKKLVLMSATISEIEVRELGLQNKRIKFISAESCIPAENRPVIIDDSISVTGSKIKESAALIAAKILNILEQHPDTKGLVHATYAQAEALKPLLRDNPRLMFHNRTDKKIKYQEFKDSKEDKMLVCSGLYEGVDLPGEDYALQLITKVPFPNLGEPAVAYRKHIDKDWYSWQASKVMLQACGRICRTPTDYGKTIILDNNFKRLYDNNPTQYPEWFKQSVKMEVA